MACASRDGSTDAFADFSTKTDDHRDDDDGREDEYREDWTQRTDDHVDLRCKLATSATSIFSAYGSSANGRTRCRRSDTTTCARTDRVARELRNSSERSRRSDDARLAHPLRLSECQVRPGVKGDRATSRPLRPFRRATAVLHTWRGIFGERSRTCGPTGEWRRGRRRVGRRGARARVARRHGAARRLRRCDRRARSARCGGGAPAGGRPVEGTPGTPRMGPGGARERSAVGAASRGARRRRSDVGPRRVVGRRRLRCGRGVRRDLRGARSGRVSPEGCWSCCRAPIADAPRKR